MNFTDLTIDGFGVWSGLKLPELTPGLNVFYGPNEAGKTTLLEFVRAMLYGFTPSRRVRYLPPVHGGAAGGWMGIATGNGPLRLHRFEHSDRPLGELSVAAADGTVQGEPQLRSLLGDVDEPIFQHVFAVGLDEIQQLGTLDGTAAARLLYDLSAGLDRVSLADVLRELESSRLRLLAPEERPSQIMHLWAERDKLRGQIDELSSLTRRSWRLSSQRDQLAPAIAAAESEATTVDRQLRLVELAISEQPKWATRLELNEQLAAIGPHDDLPLDAVARMERITRNLKHRHARLAKLTRRQQPLQTEAAALTIREPLWRQAPRIHALAEHESWIASLEEEMRVSQQSVEQLERRLVEGRKRLGLPAELAPDDGADTSHRKLAALRAPAAELRRTGRAARDARNAAAEADKQAQTHRRAVEQALAARGQKELNPALEQAGKVVAQLRRRAQVDDRLDRMSRQHSELDEQIHELLDRRIMPVWMLLSAGGVFAFGVLLLLVGLLAGTAILGTLGWPLAVLGLLAFGTAAATKWILEGAATKQLESCQKQVTMLDAQTKQIQEERDSLDAQFPGGGPPATRLQAAEAALAALDEILPLDAKRQTAEQELAAATQSAKQAREDFQGAHRRWRAALVANRIPEQLSPKQLGQWTSHRAELARLEQQVIDAREARDRRGRELSTLVGRIEQLFTDAELKSESKSPVLQLRQLRHALGEEETQVARRDAINADLTTLKRQRIKDRRRIHRLERARLALLGVAGVADEAEFMRRAAHRATAEELLIHRNALDRELAAACAGICTEAELAAMLDHRNDPAHADLGSLRLRLADRLSAARTSLHQLLEQRGQLAAQIQALADDRTIGRKQLELGVVEQRLAEAIDRWRVLGVTERALQAIREEYQRNRQPEALREASEYLARLTGGRYLRVWTPLEEHSLRVDDKSGQSLRVEVLSRGTREQLFLSLRLALVGHYARRGLAMPLVLDDVLVNFDADRAARAAAVLRDFAAAGHQLLVFTCHEHVGSIFETLGARVRRLPSNVDLSPAIEPVREPVAKAIVEPVVNVVSEPPRVPIVEPILPSSAPPRRRPKRVVEVKVQPPVEPPVEQEPVFDEEPIVFEREPLIEQRIIRASRRRRRRIHSAHSPSQHSPHAWSTNGLEREVNDRLAEAMAIDDGSAGDELATDAPYI